MKKLLAIVLSGVLLIGLLGGCSGAHVHVCPTQAAGAQPVVTQPGAEEPNATVAEGAVKTGLAVIADAADSTSATAEEAGAAEYNVVLAAVTVDENGVITACALDSLGASVNFDATGVITSDLTAAPQTKNELGDDYGLKAYAGSTYEWYEQAQAVADYAVGKTAQELTEGAVNESGKAADADLASVATISIGSYIDTIVKAADNAVSLGAQAGDKLVLTTINALGSSADAQTDKNGTAQLDVNVVALTLSGETITSCILDALQAKVSFDTAGQITTDLTAPMQTKNELGEAYGMKAYAGSAYEWNEQAAAFAAYATGKTAAEVAGIAVDESSKVTDADLATTVTISVGGFLGLIEKAAG